MTRTYSLGEFARLMGVHPKTVQRWDRDGTLTAKRTPTGRRVYTDEDRRRVLGFPEAQKPRFRERYRTVPAACLWFLRSGFWAALDTLQ
jgi:excisionase family DNA binding protein